MDIDEIKELVDDAEVSTSVTREEASDMLVFGRISQWDDDIAADVQTEFRGTFDLIKSKRNRILGELWANPVDVSFKAKDGADPDAGDTLTGMYRTDMMRSEEAFETAVQDQVDCGFGAFRFVTEYESRFDDMNNYQRIHAEPISEANNVVYWDSNAKKKDKSDARWCMILHTFTEKGWDRFTDENGINWDKDEDSKPQPFKEPHKSDSWFWRSKTDEIKIGEFYEKKKKRERVLMYEDPLGNIKSVYQKEVKDVIDDMEAAGFVKVGEKMKERWMVNKHIVSGEKILKTQRVPGEQIPIIPIYGDWSRVEGREIWRGIYHDAQDSQRLHNFTLSYMADVVAKGPRDKPILYPGQIQGFEFMWHQSGADDNYPYRLVNEVSPESGNPYPNQPVNYLKPPEFPQAGANLLELTRRAVDDVTGGSLSQEQMMQGQVTEGQIQSAQTAQNMETFLFQNSLALAMKQAGRVYASMAAELYDVPREVEITKPDGTETTVQVMEAVIDDETGEEVILNDISQGTFEVYAETGPSFQTQKEETLTRLQTMYEQTADTQMGQLFLLTYVSQMEGPNMDHLRDYARKQLIQQGVMEPETEEEQAMMQQMQQQGNQPDANMIMAMAEQQKAQADLLKAQSDAQDDQAQNQIKAYEAETKRLEAMAKAKKTGVEATKIQTEISGTEIDNLQKLQEAMMPQGMRQQ